MEKLEKLLKKNGLVVKIDKKQFKGNSCNIKSWASFRVWINKSGNLTVKTCGVQKSFKEWENEKIFRDILIGFEIL